MAKTVTVTIDEGSGDFSVDLTGFQGKGCDAIIKAFAEIGDVTKEIHKPEYNRPLQTQVKAGR